MLPNIGLGELTVIVLVALLVFGPKRLPEMMRQAGRAIGKFQRESQSALQELRNATDMPGDLGIPATLGAFDAPDAAPATVAPVAAAAAAAPVRTAPEPVPAKPRSAPVRKPSAKKTAAKKTTTKKTTAKKPASRAPAVTEPFEDT